MLTREENDLLTQVEGAAPMGQMMRQNYWIPCLRAGKLEADGAPIRVRLFGDNFVAFRATDGRVGFFDEACPHRGASLALARNEDCALRCIFHGWKIDVSGEVVEVPTECNEPEAFAKRVKVNHYPVREAGGLIWVWLGEGEAAKFPDLPFTHVQPHQVFVASTKIPVNWLQGLEATVDSAHIAYLHRDWLGDLGNTGKYAEANQAPRFEFQNTRYGFRGAALRPQADGAVHVRINEFVMPFHCSTLPSISAEGDYQILVPIDDTHTLWIYVRWTTADAFSTKRAALAPPGADLDNWVPPLGDETNYWGQDREAMKNGSFSGFNAGLLTEDTVVQISMGPIVDRTKEFLSTSDMAVVRARRMLMQAARDYQGGKAPLGANVQMSYAGLKASGGLIPEAANWQEHFPPAGSEEPHVLKTA